MKVIFLLIAYGQYVQANQYFIDGLLCVSDLWGRTYQILQQRIQDTLKDPLQNSTISPAIVELVGTRPPQILSMTSQEIQNALAKKTLDVGMCGFFVTR